MIFIRVMLNIRGILKNIIPELLLQMIFVMQLKNKCQYPGLMIINNFIDPLPNLPPRWGAERLELARWASLAKEPDCRGGHFPLGRNKKGGKIQKIFTVTSPGVLSAQKKNVTFTDITKKAGITFKYTFGDNSYKNIIESSGSGITIFDYNNDGLMDLYLMNGTYLEGISDPEGKIYKNSH